MDISGSISWSTKADVGLTVYRGSDNVEVHCTKAVELERTARQGRLIIQSNQWKIL